MSEAVLRVNNLQTQFQTRAGVLKAVDGVSFEVARGRILGLVGESGSGKSVTGYSILGLIEAPGQVAGGEVLLNGKDITRLKGEAMRQVRGAHRRHERPSVVRIDRQDAGPDRTETEVGQRHREDDVAGRHPVTASA